MRSAAQSAASSWLCNVEQGEGDMDKPSTDVIRRVFDEEGRYFLEVGPAADALGCVELRTVGGEHSEDWYGKLSVVLTAEMAAELARALIASGGDLKQANGPQAQIASLRAGLANLRAGLAEAKNTNLVDYIDALLGDA